jgi:hypothetical protein
MPEVTASHNKSAFELYFYLHNVPFEQYSSKCSHALVLCCLCHNQCNSVSPTNATFWKKWLMPWWIALVAHLHFFAPLVLNATDT